MNALRGSNDIRIMVCENDEQGNPSGRVTHLEIESPQHEEVCLNLEHNQWHDRATSFAECAGRLISIHGYDFKYSSRHTWVGNMMWNQYALPAPYALGLLNVLRRTREWTINEGWSELCEKWNDDQDFTCADFGFPDISQTD